MFRRTATECCGARTPEPSSPTVLTVRQREGGGREEGGREKEGEIEERGSF